MSEPEDDPTLVTALQYDEPAAAADLATWCGAQLEVDETGQQPPTIWVPTSRGPRPAGLGDWIVRRMSGEFYPCTAAEFAARHEPAG